MAKKSEPEVKVIDIAREGHLLPPPPGTCPACAVDHEPEQPHNQQSLYFQYAFYGQAGRFPKWSDAMEHCTPEVKDAWMTQLRGMGVPEDELIYYPR